jgi:hypothetical protein
MCLDLMYISVCFRTSPETMLAKSVGTTMSDLYGVLGNKQEEPKMNGKEMPLYTSLRHFRTNIVNFKSMNLFASCRFPLRRGLQTSSQLQGTAGTERRRGLADRFITVGPQAQQLSVCGLRQRDTLFRPVQMFSNGCVRPDLHGVSSGTILYSVTQ